jgi:glucosamine-6-phosphate deaminase
MHIHVLDDRRQIGRAAAAGAARVLAHAITARGRARLVAATGTSQFELIDEIRANHEVDWCRVELFHLDEYVGLPAGHPASFSRFVRERLIEPLGIEHFHLLDGTDPAASMAAAGDALAEAPVDLTLAGVGENGHLAFNDPPADFETDAPYLIVDLDDACRRQQVGEGWFASVADVPARAITMSVRQILKSAEIFCLVPDARKAEAVRACFADGVTPHAPASILQTHARTTVYLDRASAALLTPEVLAKFVA